MQRQTKRLVKLTFGWLFIALGGVGLVLPILQGFLFLAIGISLLSSESPWVARQVERLRQRFPNLFAQLDRMKDKAEAWRKKMIGNR